MNRVLTLSCGAVALWAAAVIAQSGDKTLEAAVKSFRDSKSADAVGKLMADEYITTHSDGRISGRSERLAAVGQNRPPDVSEEHVVTAGGVAVVTTRSILHNNPNDETPRRIMSVWVQKPDGWRTVATHLVRIAARGPAPAPASPGTSSRPVPPGLLDGKTVVGDAAIGKAVLTAESELEKAPSRAAYGGLLADDVQWVTRNGTVEDKATHLGHMVFPPPGSVSAFKDVQVRAYRDSAVVTGMMQPAAGGRAGQPQQIRFTHVWAHRAGKWVLLGNQSSSGQ